MLMQDATKKSGRLGDSGITLTPTAILEEYKTLRQEILNYQQFSHQINTLGLTVGGALVAAVSMSEHADNRVKIITSLGMIVIFYSLIKLQTCWRKKMNRIGRYIEYIIESNVPGLYWETAWDRDEDRKDSEEPSFVENLPLGIVQLISGFGAAFYYYEWQSNNPVALILLPLFALALVILFKHESDIVKDAEKVEDFTKEFDNLRKEIDGSEFLESTTEHPLHRSRANQAILNKSVTDATS